MRDALTQPAYQKLQAKILNLCDQTITFEIVESIPLPAIKAEVRPEDQHTGPGHTKRQKRPVPVQMPQTPPASNWATISRAVRNHPVKQIDSRLKAIVADQLGVEEQEVVPNASLVEDLDADSLDLVEFIMELEEQFHLEIPDEDAEILTTVAECQAYLGIKRSF